MLSRALKTYQLFNARCIAVASVPGPHKKHLVKDWRNLERIRVRTKQHQKALEIQGEIKKIPTTALALRYYRENQNKFQDHINYSSMIFLIARKRWHKIKGTDAFDTIRLDSTQLKLLAIHSVDVAHNWRPRELSNVAWGLGRILRGDHPRLGQKAKDELRNLANIVADLSVEKMNLFSETDLVESVKGLSDATPNHQAFFDAAEAKLPDIISRLYPFYMVDFALGFAIVGKKDTVQLIMDEFQQRHDNPDVASSMYDLTDKRSKLDRLKEAAAMTEVNLPDFIHQSEISKEEQELGEE
jgi:hypothetical protein